MRAWASLSLRLREVRLQGRRFDAKASGLSCRVNCRGLDVGCRTRHFRARSSHPGREGVWSDGCREQKARFKMLLPWYVPAETRTRSLVVPSGSGDSCTDS